MRLLSLLLSVDSVCTLLFVCSDSFRESVFNTGRISISRDFRWQALKLRATPNALLHVTYVGRRFKKVSDGLLELLAQAGCHLPVS